MKGRREMNGIKKIDRISAVNYIYFAYLIGFALSGFGFVYNLVAEVSFSWILFIIAAIFLAILLLDAPYYVFTKDGITSVKLFGSKSSLAWSDIISITKCSLWESVKELPHYSIIHNEQYKGRITQTETKFPLSPKIKTAIKTFYSGDVIGEDVPRKKK